MKRFSVVRHDLVSVEGYVVQDAYPQYSILIWTPASYKPMLEAVCNALNELYDLNQQYLQQLEKGKEQR